MMQVKTFIQNINNASLWFTLIGQDKNALLYKAEPVSCIIIIFILKIGLTTLRVQVFTFLVCTFLFLIAKNILNFCIEHVHEGVKITYYIYYDIYISPNYFISNEFKK